MLRLLVGAQLVVVWASLVLGTTWALPRMIYLPEHAANELVYVGGLEMRVTAVATQFGIRIVERR